VAQPAAHTYFSVVLLERPITLFQGATVVCSHLDSDLHANVCRLAIMGTVVFTGGFLDDSVDGWRRIPAVRHKHRRVILDRVEDARTCIVNGLLHLSDNVTASHTTGTGRPSQRGRGGRAPIARGNIQNFIGMPLHAVSGGGKCEVPEAGPPPTTAVVGRIEGAFGQSGKARVVFPVDLFTVPPAKATKPHPKHVDPVAASGTEPTKAVTKVPQPPRIAIYLYTKKYPFAVHAPTSTR